MIVEYALRDTSKPMGVASYEVRRGALPEGLKDSLPSIERLEEELDRALDACKPIESEPSPSPKSTSTFGSGA